MRSLSPRLAIIFLGFSVLAQPKATAIVALKLALRQTRYSRKSTHTLIRSLKHWIEPTPSPIIAVFAV
jgi:hypothetical protein